MENSAKSVFISFCLISSASFFGTSAQAQDANASNATISSPSSGFSIFNPSSVTILPAPFNAISTTAGLTTGVAAVSANGNPASSGASGTSASGATATATSSSGSSSNTTANQIKTTSFTTSAALNVPKAPTTGIYQAAPAFQGASALTKAPGSPSTGGGSASGSSGSGGASNPAFEASPF